METRYLWWKDHGKSSIRDPISIAGWRGRCGTYDFGPCVRDGRDDNLFRHERKLGRAGAGALIDLAILALTISLAFVAHLIEIGSWAALLVTCGEFQEFGNAYYHSAVNYTTLGYGDLLLTPSWRMLGPLEAANGALMFGVWTAMISAVVQRLVLARFEDLRWRALAGTFTNCVRHEYPVDTTTTLTSQITP